jgi:hypothetical protein
MYLDQLCDRENKFVIKASEHIQRTAQKFTDEDALMTACFHTLTDDVVEHERRAARMHLYRWDKCDVADQELRHDLDIEAGIRTEEDVELLDTIVETQQLLQKTVSNTESTRYLLCVPGMPGGIYAFLAISTSSACNMLLS